MRTKRVINETMFYKYRSLDNFEYLLDMVVRDRLYAAKLSELNDPMEGIIKADAKVPRELYSEWEDRLREVRVASFTTEKDNKLMWAHYADGGRGCRIGFELHPNVTAERVNYKKAPTWDGTPVDKEKLRMLLRYKLYPWRYEREFRIVTIDQCFVPVKVKTIEFGSQIEPDRQRFLEHILSQLRPDVHITKKIVRGKVNPFHATGGATKYVTARPQSFDGCSDCANRQDRIDDMSFYRQVNIVQRYFDSLDDEEKANFLRGN